MKWILRVLIVALTSFYVVLIGLAVFSNHMIFQPQPSSYSDESLGRSAAELGGGRVLHLGSDSDRLTAVYLPNAQAKYTLLFSHGNAEDLGDDLSMMEMYRHAGFAVFSYDYRGYGTSTGHPTETGTYKDAEAAWHYLTNDLRIPAERVIVMGRSVGCGPAIYTASTRKVAGLIAEAPFTTGFRVLTRVRLLPWDKFNNLRNIRNVHAPVLIIHGRNDQVIPFWHGERVFQEANEPKRFMAVDGAGHNDVMFFAGKKYFEAMQEFASDLPGTAN